MSLEFNAIYYNKVQRTETKTLVSVRCTLLLLSNFQATDVSALRASMLDHQHYFLLPPTAIKIPIPELLHNPG
ncbi:MAG: hypothetical protein KDC86_13560 [Saprospiraceae bacterium]|nr:hypothetical protein [Saprospiraceae bacterium]